MFILESKSTSTSCKSPTKKARDKNRKPLNCNDKRLNSGGLVELEERLCPVNGCDSLGHLNGLYERHFTSEACPMYHRLTIKQCQVILMIICFKLVIDTKCDLPFTNILLFFMFTA
jgi:hypothetical protein